MSYVLSTTTVGIYRGQDRPGGVPVLMCGVATLFAPEDPLGEPELLLGYREALGSGPLPPRRTEYRHPVLVGGIDAQLKEVIGELCAERDAPIVELETMTDHVHPLVSCDAQFGIHRFVKQIEGRSSRSAPRRVPHPRSRLPTV